jgi:hypothetical protein
VGRKTLSWLRHPVQNQGFPAEHERLVTAEELSFLA